MRITFQNITKKYGAKYALRDFSAQLADGVYGLLGANGAGKTTLINILAGITPRSGGEILLDGENISRMGNNFLSKIGYMPQYPQFYKDFKVLEFLDYMSAVKGLGREAGRKSASRLLELCNLTGAASTKIGALSGGMRQRVGIAQAMLNDPKILILDEPTAGLDPDERIRFRNLISCFADNRLVLLSTHIVTDVESIASEVIILKQGKLLRQGSPDKLMRELDGMVWLVTVPSQKSLPEFGEMKISNLQHDGEKIILRIISPIPPTANAVNAKPNLEDVFLSCNSVAVLP